MFAFDISSKTTPPPKYLRFGALGFEKITSETEVKITPS